MVLGFFRALCFLFLLLGCSNPYERDNPQDTIHTYTVTFNAGEAAGGVPPADMAGHYGDFIKLPDVGTLERAGYSFGGWNAVSPYMVTGNATLYARWIPVYTVSFDGNGATGGTPPTAVSADSGSVIQLPGGGSLERAGYSFGGWNAVSPYMVTGNATLYARWIPVYTVSFDGNGATGGTPPTAVSADSGSVIQLPGGGSLERSDYLFTGWNANSSGTGTRYEAGSSYTVAGNMTFYAIWTYCPGYNPGTHICDERDLQAYRITTIGTQTWLAENLNHNATSSKCYSDQDSNCDKYGRLYNWATTMGLPSSCNSTSCSSQIGSPHRGICPSGWHIPSNADWDKLYRYADGTSGTESPYSSSTAGTKLKSQTGWNSYSGVPAGTDEFGFSALPGGHGSLGGSFDYVGDVGSWWSASEDNSGIAYGRRMYYSNEDAGWNDYGKSHLFSVRCLQD